MFQLQKPDQARFENAPEMMVDDDGTSIRVRGVTRDGEQVFDYFDPSTGHTFKFEAGHMHQEAHDAYWRVSLPVASLAPAIIANPELEPESFKSKVFAKIEQCLLAWPLHPVINPVQARRVSFIGSSTKESLTEWVSIARAHLRG
jgi:hypothetical protein